jgi:hypothetical protein
MPHFLFDGWVGLDKCGVERTGGLDPGFELPHF